MKNYELKKITAAEARPHRQEILRKGQPVETVIYPKDDAPESVHFAIEKNGKVLAITTLLNDPFPVTGETAAWRMRGVATYPQARRKGYGSILIQACIDHARSQGGKVIWCNARIGALDFYFSSGFLQHGKPFDIPGAGEHYRLYLPLE